MSHSDENQPPAARRGFEAPGHETETEFSPPRYAAGGTYGAPRSSELRDQTPQEALTAARPARAASSARPDRRFRGAVVRTFASTILPGLGLIGTRAHNAGVVILTVLGAGTVALVLFIRSNPAMVVGSALQADWMFAIGVALACLGLLWVTIIVGTFLVSRPRSLTPRQRVIGSAVVGVLSLLVSAPMAVASAYSFQTAALSGGVFVPQDNAQSKTRPTLDSRDPWANKPRVNVLLLGGDSGEGREADLGVRTDTIMLASIDTQSGATLIVQLPRNLQYPIFPPGSELAGLFPYGFNDGGNSFLNAVWHDVPTMYPDLFADTDYPGADALKSAVEGVTGLPVDYFALVNIDGLVALVDAMGGVRLNVNFPIAMGGSDDGLDCGKDGWIPEGPDQLLGGNEAMWYARSRCNSPGGDFGRMQRQSCLVDAVIAQADPAVMVTRYEGIAKAAGDMVSTDIPQEHISAMVDLALRVQTGQRVSRLAFVHGENGYYSDGPDFDLMHRQVQDAIQAMAEPTTVTASAEPQQTQAPVPADPASEAPVEPGVQQTTQAPAENIADACAYRHEEPNSNVPIPETVPVYTPPATEPGR